MAEQPLRRSVITRLTLEVTYADGRIVEYRTNAMDNWRLEDFMHARAENLGVRELAFLAYSAALRTGDAYTPRKNDEGNRRAQFESWWSTVEDLAVLRELEADVEAPPDPTLAE
jgi:hypothetical protein